MSEDLNWEPIETAPKNAPLLACMPARRAGEEPRIAVIWWDEQFYLTGWEANADHAVYTPAWTAGCVASSDYEKYAREEPTHWMPLPKLPKTDASDLRK